MKSLHTCILLLTFFTLSSCSKKSDDDSDNGNGNVNKKGNLLATGASAHDLLSNDKFDKLKIEIAYVTGLKPSTTSMLNFVAYLKTYTFKEDIQVVYLELPSPEEEDLTVQEIADLETKNRTVYNDDKTLAIYIYFADAPAEDDEEEEGLVTLGAVYRNTSMVIHEVTIQKFAQLSTQISNTDIEVATLNHEFGHLFGLVNLGSQVVNEHEDSESTNHCNIEGCLMRAELQFGGSSGKSNQNSATNGLHSSCSLSGKSILNILKNKSHKGANSAVPLDAECILDLQSNGGR